MKKNLPLLLLVLLIGLGLFFRFFKLGLVPSGLYLDEASQGYNAYSILTTGKDEFGQTFPVIFRSFADFKTPIYTYLIVPFIPLFGLTPQAVRLPSAILSVLTPPLLYLLIRQLLPRSKTATALALLTVLFLAISPWHVVFGRADFEANAALFFLLLALYLFYLSFKHPLILLPSIVGFVLSTLSYHSERLLVPLTIIFLFARHRQKLSSATHRLPLVIGLALGLLLSLPTLRLMTTPGFLARATTLNITSDLPSGYLSWYQGPAAALVNAAWYLRIKEFFALYFSYFSPRNLFFLSDANPRLALPDLPVFFLWQLPLYLFGFYLLITDKSHKELRALMIFLLLAAPLPAALTRDPFSTIRALPLVIPLTVLISLALIHLFAVFKSFPAKILFSSGLFLFLIHSLLALYSSVFVLNETINAKNWNYGWRQVVARLATLDPSLPIVIDNVRGEVYAEILFFSKFAPKRYQAENFEVSLDRYYLDLKRNPIKKIGQLTVRPISWKPDLQVEQYLVGDHLAISKEQIDNHQLTLIEEVVYPDGSPAFRIVKTNP